jgi:hypothetical protein
MLIKPPASRLPDLDMQAAPAAMLRAAEKARLLAEQTGTPWVVRCHEVVGDPFSPFGTKAVIAFLRSARDEGRPHEQVVAVELINRQLDEGQSLQDILASETGFYLDVTAKGGDVYQLSVGFKNKRGLPGDGGTWTIRVGSGGEIIDAAPEGRIFFD